MDTKIAIIVAMLLIGACAHKRLPPPPGPFNKEMVCSPATLERLAKAKGPNESKYPPGSLDKQMLLLQPQVKGCYEGDLAHSGTRSFNLCLVVEKDPKGKLTYFEFSSREAVLTPTFLACLDGLKDHDAFRGLTDVIILQPFRLYPKQ